MLFTIQPRPRMLDGLMPMNPVRPEHAQAVGKPELVENACQVLIFEQLVYTPGQQYQTPDRVQPPPSASSPPASCIRPSTAIERIRCNKNATLLKPACHCAELLAAPEQSTLSQADEVIWPDGRLKPLVFTERSSGTCMGTCYEARVEVAPRFHLCRSATGNHHGGKPLT